MRKKIAKLKECLLNRMSKYGIIYRMIVNTTIIKLKKKGQYVEKTF